MSVACVRSSRATTPCVLVGSDVSCVTSTKSPTNLAWEAFCIAWKAPIVRPFALRAVSWLAGANRELCPAAENAVFWNQPLPISWEAAAKDLKSTTHGLF